MDYWGSTVHRIIPGFMLQGGDYEKANGTGGQCIYGQQFEDESFGLHHSKPYLLSMANSGPNTNGSQFFITFKETPHLDGKHVVFGEVIDGFNVVDAVEKVGSSSGTPHSAVTISGCNLL